ncbi:MAG: COQ9 family protein [Alphaproteobacteria bacterium]|nr:COQ9 family protein [Alphaproteobacteria bacterium]
MDWEAKRERLLEATLGHVPFDGWTDSSLRRAAADLGLAPADVLDAFPGGAVEALDLFIALADRRMLADLEAGDLASLKVRERVLLAVRRRLERALPHREAVRRGLAALALPQNAPLALKSLYRTVDAVWFGIGDTSTDWNFYSKRAILAGVYGATVLYWLDDRSEGQERTWDFLARRLDDAIAVPRALGRGVERLRKLASDFPGPFRRFGRAFRG